MMADSSRQSELIEAQEQANSVHPLRPISRVERRKMGKVRRQQAPLKSHREYKSSSERPDPLLLLQRQDEDRVAQLLPIKYGRMMESPFTFYRGSAIIMTHDLAQTPSSRIGALLCGDAHLSNFGIFATPERRMVFDVNDFDEAYAGPWEWDVKRLAASAVIAGRDNGLSDKKCLRLASDTVRTYGKAIDAFSQMNSIDRWYYHVAVDSLLAAFDKASGKSQKSVSKMIKKAQTKTQKRTLKKLTHMQDGRLRFNSEPPLLVPLRDLGLERYLDEVDIRRITIDAVTHSWDEYLTSLPDERRRLLERYHVSDVALRVGGIGSVGTRCAVVLLKGSDEDDALILQVKEAGPSVLEAYVDRKSGYENNAQRVVTAQRLMQATNDIFLGWSSTPLTKHHYYWRQLKDMKGSADIEQLDESGLRTYLDVCSFCLARAHARTGDPSQISGYIGSKDIFAKAVGKFSIAYADQAEQDHGLLVKAIKAGRIAAEKGV